jgi:hypothetical protein
MSEALMPLPLSSLALAAAASSTLRGLPLWRLLAAAAASSALGLQPLHGLGELRAFGRGPADAVVGKDPRGAGGLECVSCKIQALFRGGNPRVPDNSHGRPYSLNPEKLAVVRLPVVGRHFETAPVRVATRTPVSFFQVVCTECSKSGLLIEEAARWAAAHGLGRMTLTTIEEVPWNAPYYRRLGFQEMPDSQ